jgi:hypothetical protein
MNDLADRLREAAKALEAADDALRGSYIPEQGAVHYELVQAAANVGRALHLIGEVR